MSSTGRVALVTGGNKGIGYAIVAALCRKLKDQGVVYLAARDEKLGQEAVKKLAEEGLHSKFVRLDLEDVASIEQARDVIQKEHGGLDILVNNAGMAFKNAATEPFAEQAEKTVAVNFFGTLNVCKILFPILRPQARVVNVSSMAGDVAKISSAAITSRITSDNLTQEELVKIMEDFVAKAQDGSYKDAGYPNTSYGMSKIGVTALSAVQQRAFDQLGTNIVVNSCCPGWVATDMSSHKGPKTTEEGADTPTYLALLPARRNHEDAEPVPHGSFVYERNIIDWTKGHYKPNY